MKWTTQQIGNLSGKVMLVTGGNSGIGLEAARALAVNGARVILACRDRGKAEAAAEQIRNGDRDALVETLQLDLADLASVRRAAEEVKARLSRLDVLINNAGVMAIPRALTADGIEMQIGVNHFGHFALTGLLIDLLLSTPSSRIVSVSSSAHKIGNMKWEDLDRANGYSKWGAYGQSKLANLLFAFELERRLRGRNATAMSLACHPGYAATNLQFVGPQITGSHLEKLLMQFGNSVMAQSAEAGAWPTLYAATYPEAKGGEFIGPAGLGHMRGRPEPMAARKAAYNPALMQKLWDVSVARTDVDFL
jgi:NAD(P)-dependent dehydrogenase (short-subunit alcohol dehydrogenase family)